ncbi:PA14 domain-containing protein [Prosthecobacter sp.]|uniref:PA14 domain-containing protein n=1 Tax=Prosthecobacter sp. TaxID=1965333 RepID=UPI001D6F9A58|nr:PA14 domain-containing protein [Prosthecobacter sp.]MCB1276944.1 DUF1929 domain-containing protein [Prosthecobacter sp.]
MKRLLIAIVLTGTLTRADVLTHEESDALAAEAALLAPAPGPTVTQTLPPPPSQYSTLGVWSAVIPWTPHIPVTCAQLPDGRLLTFASSQRTSFPAGTFTYAATWDYRTGQFVEINNTRHDMFCAGVSLLADGRLLVNGGNNTIRDSSIFDWRTNTWSAAQSMQDPRWYNTSVALPNGTVFTASGSGGSDTAERWQSSTGWTRLTGINWALAHGEGGVESTWHPFLHVAPDGRIAHTGPTHTMHWVDPTGSGQFISTSTTIPGAHYPKDGALVMFNEGKVLQAGGRTNGTDAPSNLAYVVDINGSTPTITQTGSLKHKRTYVNGVVLPTGEVMALGGNTSQVKFSDEGSVMTPEIWNPTTGQWRTAAGMQVPRNYHSLAVLLPDGRVWSGGGGLSGNSADHQDAQIYTPAELYNADGTLATRPVITEAPAVIGPGMAFTVRAAAGIKKFSFIKLTSLTHSVTSDLRFLNLDFVEESPGIYAVQSHSSLNVMTPGYWMLFAVSAEGPYSVSETILVDPTVTDSISHPDRQFITVGDSTSLTVIANGYSASTRVFSAIGLPPGVSIDASTGVISGAPEATGAYTTIVTVNDGVLPEASASFQWTVHSDLKLVPLASAPAPSGEAIQFHAAATGSLNPEFKWDFGDGSSETVFSSNPTVSKTYSAPGRYLVTLTARDDTGSWVTLSFRQAVHAPLTPTRPTSSSSIAYQSRNGANARLWVVNPDQDSVTVFDAVTRKRSGIIAVGKGPRSIAIAPDGRAWVINSESGSISIIGPNLVVAQTVPLPRGSRPHAIVFDPAGTSAYVSLQDLGEVLKINPTSPKQILATIFVGQNVRHLSVGADGSRVFASRFITPRLPGEETATVTTEQGATKFGGEVVLINAASMTVAKTIILEHSNDADSSIAGRGIPNYLGPSVLSPDGLSAWVPSKKDNIKRGMLRDGRPLTHDSAVRSITSRIDLNTESEDFTARVDFNDAGIAVTAAFDPAGMYLFTALEGSREVAVVDSWGRRELLRFDAGRAPQGVVTSPDGRTLYVHNFMDRSVTVHDVGAIIDGAETTPALTATLNCIASEKLPAAVLKGKQFFYDSLDQRIALQKYVSCAACHNDGDQDGRVWDFTGFGEGLRNNISLKGHGTHGPVHWTGNFDEIQDFEGQIRSFAGGLGLMSDADFHTGTRDQSLGDTKAGVSEDLDALAAYVTSLTTTGTSPFRSSSGALTADALAGQQIFRAQNCAACHSGTRFTNSALNVFANVGTIKPSSGQRLNAPLTGLDVPTLRGLWNTAPYLHDGSATTLSDAVRAHQGVLLTDSELSKVVSFLSQIDDAVMSAPAPLNVVLGTARSTVSGSFPVAGVLSEAAVGFTSSDISIEGGTISGFAITGTSFSFHVEPSAASVRIEIAANVMTDTTGLGNLASNVLNITNTGDLPSTIPPPPASNSNVQPHIAQGGGASDPSTASFVPVTAFAARINFQNAGAPTPNGYAADNGAIFAARNGLEYGWNLDHSALGRDRNGVSDQRQDTLIRMQAGAKWEITVPNGEYDIVLSVGDATMASKNTLRAEGTTVWSAFACAAGTFQTKTVRVIVADGRLTIDNGSASTQTTSLNFIEIASTHGTLPTAQNGLSADYYAGTNFEQLRFSRTDRAVDFRWNGSAPDTRVAADNFSVCWHGYIVPRHSEHYTFTTTSDDGVRVWINGRLIINNWTNHSEQANTGEIDLQADTPVTIQMEFFESGGDAVARLMWESPSQVREIVPNERLLADSTNSYPSTFAAWIDSGRSNAAGGLTTAATNADGDDFPDLLEYALGGSAGSGIHAGEDLRLDLQNGHVNASIVHPQGIGGLQWLLESSTDLKAWTLLITTPAVITNLDGTETLRWENLDAAGGQNIDLGIVRLKVQNTITNETAAGKPVAWQKLTVQQGVQTAGMNLLNAPVFSGLAHSAVDNAVYLADASYLPGVFDPDARYYLEIKDGPHAGHHFDLAHIGDRVLLIDTESPNNTLPEAPMDIGGARIAIHKHITLGQVFDKNILNGTTNPSTADQVLFSTPSGFQTFWLLKGGSYHQWNAAGDATLTNADTTIIPPGTGVLLKTGNSSPRALVMTGEVRTTPFARLLSPGFNLFANPWPLDATPSRLNMTDTSIFTATMNPGTADALQLWKGDSQPGSSGYDGYWLFQYPKASAIWTSTRDASLRSQNDILPLKAAHCAFLNRRSTLTSVWVMPAP